MSASTSPGRTVFLAPRPLDRSAVAPFKPGDDPRVPLVDWIVDPKNAQFSGAMVNRIWKHYLGVGLVEPVDDLRASNPPSNPELWKALEKHFVESKFDLRSLMRLVLNSRTYQLSSSTTADNAADTRFYSHYVVRRLPAEVLLDAVSGATGEPEKFPGYPVGPAGGPTARSGPRFVLPQALRPLRPRDGLCLRAERRGDAAATLTRPE